MLITMSTICFDDLASVRARHAQQKIVFCSGSFDLLHAGHILFFEDCKKHGDILVVMVGNDKNVRSYKGGLRPILNESIRLKVVSSLKPVDYALLDCDAKEGDVFAVLTRVFEDLKPNYYVVNEDAKDIPRRRALAGGHRMGVIVLPRTCPPEFESLSTTAIIDKIQREQK